MGIFDSIRSSLSTGKLKKEQIERLRESIWNAAADGQITDQELEYLNSVYLGSELSQEDFDKLRAEIFAQVVQQAIADRRVVEGKLNSINRLIMATSDISTPDANSVAFMGKTTYNHVSPRRVMPRVRRSYVGRVDLGMFSDS